jgi:peptidoglycan/xylan/chitin deacetylase (PgdA/CDA1 family)
MAMTQRSPTRWRPAPLIAASVGWHAAAAAGVLARPAVWPWALGAVLANHALLTAAGLIPRSHLLGPNWTRLPATAAARGALAITIDDGPDPGVTPRVLSILAAHGVSATFFCVGERVQRHPDLVRAMLRGGHAIENHSQGHPWSFSLLGPRGLRDQIMRAQDSIVAATGCAPRFFRAPAGLRNPFLEPVLARLGLTLASWTRRGFDTVASDPAAVFARLAQPLRAGDILLLHDGNAARSPTGTPVILDVLPRLLGAVQSAGFVPVTLRAAATC